MHFSKTCTFAKFMHFSKTCTFAKFMHFCEIHAFWTNSCFLEKFMHFSHFYRIPCFFQNFRVFKKFPVQSSSRIPHKNSVFFPKIPRSGNYRLYKFRGFLKKFRVFTKFPGFQIFKSLKNTRKNHVFLYKNIYLQVKSIYLQIKNIYKRQEFILCMIFTVFLILF